MNIYNYFRVLVPQSKHHNITTLGGFLGEGGLGDARAPEKRCSPECVRAKEVVEGKDRQVGECEEARKRGCKGCRIVLNIDLLFFIYFSSSPEHRFNILCIFFFFSWILIYFFFIYFSASPEHRFIIFCIFFVFSWTLIYYFLFLFFFSWSHCFKKCADLNMIIRMSGNLGMLC